MIGIELQRNNTKRKGKVEAVKASMHNPTSDLHVSSVGFKILMKGN
jgi:hypothetical protein